MVILPTINRLQSTPVPRLDDCSHSTLLNYFENAWELEETLMSSVVGEDTFYLSPDPLRNRLIFYLGHTAVFYINKLVHIGLIRERINSQYESLFAVGVDPQTPAELNATMQSVSWPALAKVWQYREQAREKITAIIQKTPLNLPINQQHPLWALLMGIEHSRVHFETSSMLLRQLPINRLKRPPGWNYAPINSQIPDHQLREIPGGVVKIGKPENDLTYGWDSEYGHLQVEVKPFLASQYLITNREFLEFVQADGYNNSDYWDTEAWQWKQLYNIEHPKFWLPVTNGYRYRATFDEMELPLDWPVEVNYYEASAYCRWRGKHTRLMSEAEWHQALLISEDNHLSTNQNIDLKYISPTPVGMFKPTNNSGLYDLRGNVWEWLDETFKPLPGFKTHPLYKDHSEPFFDNEHQMMLGGSWATNGAMALPTYRNWFRPYFYQHVGFRIAQDLK
jgi:5-histidylcysteine sulfoxide synthase